LGADYPFSRRIAEQSVPSAKLRSNPSNFQSP
jgi:hypothetical protein